LFFRHRRQREILWAKKVLAMSKGVEYNQPQGGARVAQPALEPTGAALRLSAKLPHGHFSTAEALWWRRCGQTPRSSQHAPQRVQYDKAAQLKARVAYLER